jgi:peptidoglycan hydrolase-like protein with peptidoglycan-binding domain
MSENEDNYQPYAAGVPMDETKATEEPLYEFDSATFTSGDPAVEAAAIEPEPTPEPELEPAPKAKAKERVEDTEATHVVGLGDKDEVLLAKCVYKNAYARKSLTVHHLQRRLGELGYGDAMADRDGWYGDLTKESVKQFQGDNKLEDTGIMDAKTFERIFAGDPNVKVVTSQG